MGKIRYHKLFDLLNRRDMKKTDLLEVISAPTLAKLSKGESITTEMIERICDFLKCQPGDIMEHITEETIIKNNDEKVTTIVKKVIRELDEENELNLTEEKTEIRDKNDKLKHKYSEYKID